MPLNTRMADVVLTHTDLLEAGIMPDCLLILSAHVHGYRGVTKAWEEGVFLQHNSIMAFPGGPLLEYAESHYVRLKARQSAILGLEGELPSNRAMQRPRASGAALARPGR